MTVTILVGNSLDVLRELPSESVQMVCTSPPYWGLRSYLPAGHPDKALEQGLEATPAEFVARMVEVFREVRRVLRHDGVCFVNLGDSYAGSWGAQSRGADCAGGLEGGSTLSARQIEAHPRGQKNTGSLKRTPGLKNKDLVGIPWRVAFALQDDGWYLRGDYIWCLSGGAWVYARTQKGDMPVMVKDLVRLDPRTVKLWNGEQWTQVLGWGPSNDTSERLELVLRSGERIGCTGGHLWPTQRGNVAARDLRVSDVIKSCVLPEPDECHRPAYLTDCALWLIGLFLAEGSWSNGKAQLALSADEQHWLARIEAVARHYGGSCTHTLDGGNLSVRLYGAVLNAVLTSYIGGTVAIDKHLKVSAWKLPNAALRHIISGYLDGDAHDDTGNGRWRLGFCRNYSLERDLRTAAARLGATITLKPMVAAHQNGDAPSFRGEWRWNRSGHHNEKDRSEIVEIRQSRARQFWDIAVEDEPHLFALASGVLTHNCKPNPMPESVTDRCTKAHEYVFHLTKSERYFWDQEAIKERAAFPDGPNSPQSISSPYGQGFTRKNGVAVSDARKDLRSDVESRHRSSIQGGQSMQAEPDGKRNKRSVWTIATAPFPEAHFATFPPELPEICIKAGSRPGDTVLDPFSGAGTTALAADRLQRHAIGIELNPEYAEMSRNRIDRDRGGLLDVMEATQ